MGLNTNPKAECRILHFSESPLSASRLFSALCFSWDLFIIHLFWADCFWNPLSSTHLWHKPVKMCRFITQRSEPAAANNAESRGFNSSSAAKAFSQGPSFPSYTLTKYFDALQFHLNITMYFFKQIVLAMLGRIFSRQAFFCLVSGQDYIQKQKCFPRRVTADLLHNFFLSLLPDSCQPLAHVFCLWIYLSSCPLPSPGSSKSLLLHLLFF